jgi:hypothetical protein
MKRARLGLALVASVSLVAGGCAGLSDTQQRTLTGGAAGAAGGAIIGAIAGDAALGAAIGGGVGLAGGWLYGKHKESERAAYERGRQDAKSGR